MPHSCALRGIKLVLFLDVSAFFIKEAQGNSVMKYLFDLLNAKTI